MGVPSTLAKSRVSRLWIWLRARPALAALGALLVLYGAYLPSTQYEHFYYDSRFYWVYGQQFWKTGAFSFLSYINSMRGYLFSLLLSPFAVAAPHLGVAPIRLMQPLGMLTAAFFFGVLAPALWRAVGDPAAPVVPLSRRLVFGIIGFVLWRDYFNFPLTDFPAFFAICLAIWALIAKSDWRIAGLAGMALAAAANMRPVFQAALPFAGVLAFWGPQAQAFLRGRAQWLRAGAVAIGMAVVLLPQFYINANNFGRRTPWVLAYKQGDPTNLLLQQLQWGLQYQKYETNAGKDYALSQMYFRDDDGQALFDATHLSHFDSQAQYLAVVRAHPVRVAGVWLRHLFNGLDLQYPTPYILKVFVPTWPLAWFNYTVMLGGGMVLFGRWRQRGASWRVLLVLVALLAPCLSALPVAMECRYLLPLHLVLSGALAFGAHPLRAWQRATMFRRGAWALGYVAVITIAFSISANAQQHLQNQPRTILPFTWNCLLPESKGQP